MASAFGGGSSQSAFGARAGATLLSKATAILAALFMVGAMVLAIIGQRGPGSLLRGTPGPAAGTDHRAGANATGGDDSAGNDDCSRDDSAGDDSAGDTAAAAKIEVTNSPP